MSVCKYGRRIREEEEEEDHKNKWWLMLVRIGEDDRELLVALVGVAFG